MILRIMRLRLALPVTDLCYRFNISKTTASRIFLQTLSILNVRLKLLMHWPDSPDRQNKNQLPALEIEKTQLLQMLEYMLNN